MEYDGAKIKKMYWKDTGLVIVFLAFSWYVLGYVLINVSNLATNSETREVAFVAGLLAVIFVTSSLIAVLIHLKKNRNSLYSEELHHCAIQLDNKQKKEG